MPIEIRELVIRAVAEPSAIERDEAPSPALEADARTLLIQQCIAEVMRQLRRSQEP
jgi:hypothetical protein